MCASCEKSAAEKVRILLDGRGAATLLAPSPEAMKTAHEDLIKIIDEERSITPLQRKIMLRDHLTLPPTIEGVSMSKPEPVAIPIAHFSPIDKPIVPIPEPDKLDSAGPTAEQLALMKEYHLTVPPTIVHTDIHTTTTYSPPLKPYCPECARRGYGQFLP